MALKIYNTLSRKKEAFKPLHDGYVGMYVCGPTVYGHSHLGHAKSYVSFDVIARYLKFSGYRVLYVQNITDVGHLLGDSFEGEDRVLKQSRLEQKHPMQIAEEYTRSYFEDMDRLSVLRPDISPRASGHISEQIEIISRLIEKGFAYEVNGSVYFDVRKDPDYGKLSGRTVSELESGKRIEVKSEKKHPADFALWKRAEPEHLMRWPSPWGAGFPGWHVECSAMSMKYLGSTFDIHGGGLENQFPHHECEIAQSEGVTDEIFVRYWLHNNMVTVDGQKMGKSLNNFVTLKDAFSRWSPQVIRFFILQSHYRSTLDFSDEAVEAAATGLQRLTNSVRSLDEYLNKAVAGPGNALDLPSFRKRFLDALDDDFNSSQAIAVLFELSREINSMMNAEPGLTKVETEQAVQLFQELGGTILGIETREQSDDEHLDDQLTGLILEIRKDLRSKKEWEMSDKIRDSLANLGIAIEDKKDGTTWHRTGSSPEEAEGDQ